MRYIAITGCNECPFAKPEALGIKLDDVAICHKLASHPNISTYVARRTIPEFCPLPKDECNEP
jgi:hypothetical protein